MQELIRSLQHHQLVLLNLPQIAPQQVILQNQHILDIPLPVMNPSQLFLGPHNPKLVPKVPHSPPINKSRPPAFLLLPAQVHFEEGSNQLRRRFVNFVLVVQMSHHVERFQLGFGRFDVGAQSDDH